MKIKFTFIFLLLLVLTGCGDSGSDKSKEPELKEKELTLKEKELELKEKEKTEPEKAEEEKTEPAKDDELSNTENLIGNWFKPKEASINIKFFRDGRFEFNDYNSKKEEEELLKGKYKLSNGTLTLMYDDRPKQDFKFYRDKEAKNEYYIKKGTYYFVKGDN